MTFPSAALLTPTERAAVENVRPGCYRHYKGGLYVVLGIARNDDTGDLVVVYQSRQSYDDGLLRFRSVAEWTQRMVLPDERAREMARLNGMVSPQHMMGVPRFVRVES